MNNTVHLLLYTCNKTLKKFQVLSPPLLLPVLEAVLELPPPIMALGLNMLIPATMADVKHNSIATNVNSYRHTSCLFLNVVKRVCLRRLTCKDLNGNLNWLIKMTVALLLLPYLTSTSGATRAWHWPSKGVWVVVGAYLRVEGVRIEVTKHAIPYMSGMVGLSSYTAHIGITQLY